MDDIIDTIDDVVRILTIDSAADRLGCAEDLLDAPGELAGHGSGPHDTGGINNVVHSNVAGVLDVLDAELNSDLQTLPVSGGLGDVVSHLLGGEAEGTNLGGKRGGSSNLSSDSSQVDELNLIWVELRSHGSRMSSSVR